MHIESAGLTDVGRVREGNEDAYLIDDTHRLYLVADGMGGHRAGEIASNLVVTTFQRLLDNPPPDIGTFDTMLSPQANQLAFFVQTANRIVYERSQNVQEYNGMGSTLAAVMCTESTFIAANVGDSPIYLVRGKTIEPLSVTHTVAAELRATHPERLNNLSERVQHMLTRAIGIGPEVVPDICELQSFPGDILVLCSDGLSNKVSSTEILDITTSEKPAPACRLLVDLANRRGGEDNITVIVLKVADLNLRRGALQRLVAGANHIVRRVLNRIRTREGGFMQCQS